MIARWFRGLALLTTAGLLAAAPASVSGQEKKRVVFVVGEPEYKSEQTMAALAEELKSAHGLETTVLLARPNPENAKDIPGLEALEKADLAVFFLRWRELPADQMAKVKAYIDSGKPVVAFRTTTHAFRYPKGDPQEAWNDFGPDVLGAPWIYHYGHDSSTDVAVAPEAAADPILSGVPPTFHVRSWLYQVKPSYPAPGSKPLLIGTSVGPSDRKQRDTNPVAWTRQTKAGGKVFMTTMGHPEDFDVPGFRKLVINGIHWALDLPVPPAPAAPN